MSADRDPLQQQQEEEEEEVAVSKEEVNWALSVLAGSDGDNCSYPQGYVKRQAVFACNTCTPDASEPAGVCLACANKCHDGHDTYVLYTKRSFRCDCGNGKFGDFQCQLSPAKDEKNERNLYNHNFSGRYCTCDRPYPDADDQDDDEMIQCVVCEDWFHNRHLGCTAAEPDELQEMVCEGCMSRSPFLWTYAAHYAAPPAGHQEEEEQVDVESDDTALAPSRDEEASTSEEHPKEEEVANRRTPCKRTHQEMTDVATPAQSGECKLKQLQTAGPARPRQGAVFWPYSWRSELCTCTGCKRAYVAAGVPFLLDRSDTVLAYEMRGLDQPFGQHPLMALISSMDRVQQLEVIYGYNEMMTSIRAFFEQCASEGKTVTVEAVEEFFEELWARKRRRTNTGYQ